MQTLHKVMRILELFSSELPEWGVTEVSRELGFPKSTTSELMAGLMQEGLLRRTEGGRYRLGWRLFELNQTLLDTTEFRTSARAVIEDLVETWRETVHLAVLDGIHAVCVEKLQPSPAVKILASRVGARIPAHCCSVGKALLAWEDWERISAAAAEGFENQTMPAFTDHTITTVEELHRDLEGVRERGYAYDREERSLGLCCVAAPIRDSSGEVIAAISISSPSFRFEESSEKYTGAVLEAARRISGGENPGRAPRSHTTR
jgi:DNA-binding IclR family transcriptional regulator